LLRPPDTDNKGKLLVTPAFRQAGFFRRASCYQDNSVIYDKSQSRLATETVLKNHDNNTTSKPPVPRHSYHPDKSYPDGKNTRYTLPPDIRNLASGSECSQLVCRSGTALSRQTGSSLSRPQVRELTLGPLYCRAFTSNLIRNPN